MTIQETIDKLEEIKKNNKDGGSLHIYFPDVLPLKKIRVFNISGKAKIVVISDK